MRRATPAPQPELFYIGPIVVAVVDGYIVEAWINKGHWRAEVEE